MVNKIFLEILTGGGTFTHVPPLWVRACAHINTSLRRQQ